jgi:hypothetical protein
MRSGRPASPFPARPCKRRYLRRRRPTHSSDAINSPSPPKASFISRLMPRSHHIRAILILGLFTSVDSAICFRTDIATASTRWSESCESFGRNTLPEMRSSLRIDPWNDLSCVTFSGSALSTLPKVHNHVPKKGLSCSSWGRFVEARHRECSIATKAVGSGITGGATLDCPAAVGGPGAHSRKLGAGAPPTPMATWRRSTKI